MASPLWVKVYSASGTLVAAFRFPEDAAVCVGNFDGGCVKMERRTVWREGREKISAADSADEAAATMVERHVQHQRERMRR